MLQDSFYHLLSGMGSGGKKDLDLDLILPFVLLYGSGKLKIPKLGFPMWLS